MQNSMQSCSPVSGQWLCAACRLAVLCVFTALQDWSSVDVTSSEVVVGADVDVIVVVEEDEVLVVEH